LASPVPDDGRLYDRLYDHRKLRQWRDDAGLSREQVWAGTGCSVSWLTQLELGRTDSTPSLDMLVKLARFYGREPGELLAAAP
jgi:transcriptional regulator with XRE-family HTH domain